MIRKMPDSLPVDLFSFQAPLISLFSKQLNSPDFLKIKASARLLEWFNWYPVGSDATMRYYAGKERWEDLKRFDQPAVQILFDLLLTPENYHDPSLCAGLLTFDTEMVAPVFKRILARPSGAKKIFSLFSGQPDSALTRYLVQLIAGDGKGDEDTCIQSLGEMEDDWIRWLTMQLSSDSYAMVRAVSRILDSMRWYPTGQENRIHMYIGTGRWDDLAETGAPGCRLFLQMRGCEKADHNSVYIWVLQHFEEEEVIFALSSLTDRDLATAMHTLTSVRDPGDRTYVLHLLSDTPSPHHHTLISRLEPYRSCLISFATDSLPCIPPSCLPLASGLLEELDWYPIGNRKLLYYAGLRRWKEMLACLPASQDLMSGELIEWVASHIPYSALSDLFLLVSVLAHTHYYPLGFTARLLYAIGSRDWETVTLYGPAAFNPVLYRIGEADLQTKIQMIRVLTRSGADILATFLQPLTRKKPGLLSFIQALHDSTHLLIHDTASVGILISALLLISDPKETSELHPSGIRDVSPELRPLLLSFLNSLLPSLPYHQLIDCCTLLSRYGWCPPGEESWILYSIGKNDWEAIGRHGISGVSNVLAYAGREDNSSSFPYFFALSHCAPVDIIPVFARNRSGHNGSDYLKTFIANLSRVSLSSERIFLFSLFSFGDEETPEIVKLLQSDEKDQVLSWIYRQMLWLSYPELVMACGIVERIGGIPPADTGTGILYHIGKRDHYRILPYGRPAILQIMRLISLSKGVFVSDLVSLLALFDERDVMSVTADLLADENCSLTFPAACTRVRDKESKKYLAGLLDSVIQIPVCRDVIDRNRRVLVTWLSSGLLSRDDYLVSRSAALLLKLAWYPVGDESRFMYFLATHEWNHLLDFSLATRNDKSRILPFITRALVSAPFKELPAIIRILDELDWHPESVHDTILYYAGSNDTEGIRQAGTTATEPFLHLVQRSERSLELYRLAGYIRDPRIVPLLISALPDSSPESKESELALRRMEEDIKIQGFEILCTDPRYQDVIRNIPAITGKEAVSLFIPLFTKRLVSHISIDTKTLFGDWFMEQINGVYYSDLAPLSRIVDMLERTVTDHYNEIFYHVGKRDWDRVRDLSGDDIFPLTNALRHETREHCYAIIRILGQIARDTSTDALISCLYYKDPGIRKEATAALAKIQDARKICPLVHVLADQDQDVRKEALDAIIRFGEAYGNEEVIACLINQVRDTSSKTKKPYTPVIRSIIDIDDPKPVRYFLSLFADSSLKRHDELFDYALFEYKVQICDWLCRIILDPRYDRVQIEAIASRLRCHP
ncbi:MAG: HEAT repeat domain-containing protein [Methanospirillaceae archaeon]|nr:HEAT repeat domain-containing protein [Methanospirillaceae archaeon]